MAQIQVKTWEISHSLAEHRWEWSQRNCSQHKKNPLKKKQKIARKEVPEVAKKEDEPRSWQETMFAKNLLRRTKKLSRRTMRSGIVKERCRAKKLPRKKMFKLILKRE